MALTADILAILDRALLPEGFQRLPSEPPHTRWWKRITLPSDSDRFAAVIIDVIPGRQLGQFTVVPDLRLDMKPLAPQNAPAVFQGTIHDWVHRHLAMYPTLAEIEDFYHREAA